MLHALLLAAISGFSTYQPVTLATPVPHPDTPPCRVVLFKNHGFVGDAPFLGSYSPTCTGPWARVILRIDTRIRGTQYDRMGALWLNRAELLRFTTAEPTKHGIAYSIQKDVTAYSPLLREPGSVVTELANYLNKADDGIYYLDAYLDFYRATPGNPAPKTPDVILPIDDELNAVPWRTTGPLTETLDSLPRNIIGAQLDLYASNHGCDEFWYTNVPDAYAAKHKADGLCGGGTYREIDVMVDGKPASVVYPFPYIWTGGINPLLWRPLPAIDTLDVPAYRVDLDPWAGVLSDGKPHTITLSVLNDRGSWPIDANLMLRRDSRSSRISGQVVEDTISRPKVRTADSLGPRGGTYSQTSRSAWAVKGYVDGGAQRVWHTVEVHSSFENSQWLDLKSGAQNAVQNEAFVTRTIEQGPHGRQIRTTATVYPLTADSVYPPLSAKSKYSLVIDAYVRQSRVAASFTPGVRRPKGRCIFSVIANATLKRRKDGTEPVAKGTTYENHSCSGPHGLDLSARSRDGMLLKHQR